MDILMMAGITARRQVLLFISVLSLSAAVGQVSYSIPEEMAKGSFVGNIAQDLGLDIQRLKSGRARVFTRDNTAYIELNSERGILLLKERIDREALCGQMTPCALHFQILLENPMEFYSVTVEITDINDNPPTFITNEAHFNISESALSGTAFVLDRATDLDVGENSLKAYALKPSDIFSLKINNQGQGSKNVEMVLNAPLDREKNEHLRLVLTAVDGGEPRMTGTMQIHINVLDANDNAPVFTQPVYKAFIKENAPVGTVVGTVTATDADDGSNGRITYSISAMLDHAYGIFEINKRSGEVTLIGKVDYEKTRTFQINVRASDDGGLSGSCKLIADVIDTNDNRPEIHIMSKSNVISEDAKPNTVVTMINVEDADSSENGKVQCDINDSNSFILKSVSEKFYSLMTDSDLDRERASEYNITVTCSDEGVPSLSSSVTLTLQISDLHRIDVEILDINDNAPYFSKKEYNFQVIESASPGARYSLESASDPDVAMNTIQTYKLNPSDNFKLNVVSLPDGTKYIEMVLHTSLDREKQEEHKLTLTAFDGGNPQKSGSVKINVIVLDANDNAPVFSQSVYRVTVPENAPKGAVILRVSASDNDKGTNEEITFSFSQHTSSASSLFIIDPHSGEISVTGVLDYEKAKHYEINIEATDKGGLTDTSKVLIEVTDLNDNAPIIICWLPHQSN
uniref:Cadherin domain-containing protein n=1 Tax=Pundamilia nyererei TaxID=303518 RepID=A0A3B4GMD4_9CICH